MSDQIENLTDEYSRFNSWSDYEYFHRLVKNSPDFKEVPVCKSYPDVGQIEYCYLHIPSGRTYRLTEPDGPFRGVWEIVPQEELSGGQT